MDSDFLLIQKMKLGDETAIDTFVRKYYSRILKYCTLHVRDAGCAEDLVQETFEKFFRSFGQYEHYGKAANYLYVIAANTCRDYGRKKQEIPIEEIKEQASSEEISLENRLLIQMALDRLSPELRETAILYFYQELKQKEIARILNIGIPLVKYRIQRAREQLKSYLREEGPT